jgi:hypothetical protein
MGIKKWAFRFSVAICVWGPLGVFFVPLHMVYEGFITPPPPPPTPNREKYSHS